MDETLMQNDNNNVINDDAVFNAAVDIVQNLPKKGPVNISMNQKLKLYSLFKQGTIGKCNIACPPLWCVVERIKWNAWSSLGSMEPQAAKRTYIDELKSLINNVQSEYNIAELAAKSDEQTKQLLKMKLPVLGYDLSGLQSEADLDDFQKAQSSSRINRREKQINDEIRNSTGDECSTSGICSDDEYVDAVEYNEELQSSRSKDSHSERSRYQVFGCFGLASASASGIENVNLSTRKYLKALINLLSYIRRIVMNFLLNTNGINMVRQIRKSWKLILFVVFWPFIVNLTMAYVCYRKLTHR